MNVHEYIFSELYFVLTNADLMKVHFIHECTRYHIDNKL